MANSVDIFEFLLQMESMWRVGFGHRQVPLIELLKFGAARQLEPWFCDKVMVLTRSK
jgi:hypothetical protein